MSKGRASKKAAHNRADRFKELEVMSSYNSGYQTDRVKKTWSKHDIKSIRPLNDNQAAMISEYQAGQNLLAIGSAGVGKTYLGLYLALNSLLSFDSDFDRIIIVRSAVPSRDMGFMPGTLEEKTALYETPYVDIFEDLLGRASSYKDMKLAGKVEFMTTSFVRGLTFDNAIIVFDEVQNATDMEIHSVLTRVGKNSTLIICGDGKQDDLHGKRNSERSGFYELVRVCEQIESISTVTFTEDDIVRSGFVKEWIKAKQRLSTD